MSSDVGPPDSAAKPNLLLAPLKRARSAVRDGSPDVCVTLSLLILPPIKNARLLYL